MSFYKLQERLRSDGWFVEWGMPCCQTCAWGEIPFEHEEGPFKGKEVDTNKVLMNHEQDCEVDDYVDCCHCLGEGYDEETDEECAECNGEGMIHDPAGSMDNAKWFHTMYCFTPDEQHSSYFMFSNSEEGLKNLNDILPIIEESGCGYNWSGSGDARIDIYWS